MVRVGKKAGQGDKGVLKQNEVAGLVAHKSRRADGQPSTPQLRRPRSHGWTMPRREAFLDMLKATSNVSEAARSVGLTPAGAYEVRRRDKAFAAEWQEALEQGYAELEMALLRQSIHGSETTETLDDGNADGRKRVKTVHSYPHMTGLRLLMAHKSTVDAYRNEQGIDRPGSEEVRAQIARRLAETRARISGDICDIVGGGEEGAAERDGDA